MSLRFTLFIVPCMFLLIGCGGSSDNRSNPGPSPSPNRIPIFSSQTTATVVENSENAVYVASASDPDGDPITFSLSGVDANTLNINSTTGEVSFISSPNFEEPGDADTNNNYNLTITANDGSANASLNVTITVSDVNEPPEFEGPRSFQIDEGYRIYLSISPDEPTSTSLRMFDPEGDGITREGNDTVLGGPDAAFFNVSAEGRSTDPLDRFIIATALPFDFEEPQDSDGNNEYVIDISVTDGTSTGNISLTFIVHDIPGTTLLEEQSVAALVGIEEFGDFGTSMAFVGDLNDDGVPEIAIGAERTKSLELVGGVFGRPGAVYLISGADVLSTGDGKIDLSTTSPSSTVLVRWPSTIQDRSPEFGHRVRSLGDIDGDGYDELAVSADGGGSSPPRTSVTIIPGVELRSALIDADISPEIAVDNLSTIEIVNSKNNFGLGWDMATLPDLDGDSVDEFLVCASGARANNGVIPEDPRSGSVFVIFGNALAVALASNSDLDVDALISASNAIRLDGADRFRSDCTAVASAGDFDNDGLVDILVGEGRTGEAAQSRAHLIFGSTILNERSEDRILRLENLESDGVGFSIISEVNLDNLGGSVSGIGDFNNDGFDDIAIGASRFGSDTSESFRGSVYVLFGTNSRFLSPLQPEDIAIQGLGFIFRGNERTGDFGRELAPAGDLDQDGYSDFFIMEPRFAAPRNGFDFTDNGQILTVFGNSLEAGRDLSRADYADGVSIIGTAFTSGMESISAISDFDGDGLNDLQIGATNNGRCNDVDGVDTTGNVMIVLGSRIHEERNEKKQIDLNNHLYGGLLPTDIPGSSSLSECVSVE